MAKVRSPKVVDLFSGYQVEEIMRVCKVSRATALHFKRGTRAPSPQSKKLWWLHIGGRILPSDWRSFRVHNDSLVDDAGSRYAEAEIAAIPVRRQQVAELQHQLDKVRHTKALGELGLFEFTSALRSLLQQGALLLETADKIPKRGWGEVDEAESKCVGKPGIHRISN